MKKTIKLLSVVCAIVMLLGMLPILSVSAAEEPTLVLTPSSDVVKAGKEFSIKIDLANNPGINYLTFNMYFDDTAFECLIDKTIVTGSMFSTPLYTIPSGTTDSARFSGNHGAFNAEGDGFVVEFFFRAKADAALKDYTFTTVLDAKNTINNNAELLNVLMPTTNIEVVDANANLTTIDGAQVNLGTDISVTYKVTLDPDHAGAQMKFTTHGKEYYADPVETAEANVYEYTLINIAPQCMGDNIKAEVIFGGVAVATYDNYSILKNCENLQVAYPENVELNTLINDLLVYGAAAQKYQNYKTNALVTDATAPVIENDPDSTYIEESGDDVAKITSLGVKFDYTNALYIKFVAPEDTSESNFMINVYNDAETIYTEYYIGDCGEAVDGIYTIYSPNVSVLDYGETIYIDMYVGGMKARNIVQALEYTVNDYCYRMQQSSSNPAMVELAQALYYYGQSAVAYQNAN